MSHNWVGLRDHYIWLVDQLYGSMPNQKKTIIVHNPVLWITIEYGWVYIVSLLEGLIYDQQLHRDGIKTKMVKMR